MSNTTNTTKKANPLSIVGRVVGIILCLVLAFLLVCNILIIVRGSQNDQKPPSVFGVTPMIVLSQSMSGDTPDHIEIDDLIFIKNCTAADLDVGDVVSFMEGKIVVTHKILEKQNGEDGSIQFITGGINNLNEDGDIVKDTEPVTEANVIGEYMFRIPKLGAVVYFMQQPLGMICFIGIPLFAFIIYDIIRRQRAANKEGKKTSELEAELERLRALAGESKEDEKKEAAPEAEEAPAVEETPAE